MIFASCAASSTTQGVAVPLHPADPTPVRDNVQLAAAEKALAAQDVDAAKTALAAAEQAGQLGHDQNVKLWEQRGIADAYVDDEPGASAAFDMMLALDPLHILSYTLSPKATFVFEKVRAQKDRVAPELEVTWAHGGKIGDPVPIDIEVIADPKQFLKRATLFVRTHGEASWRATDLALDAKDRKIVLPPATASLEIFAKAYDDRGNEVLVWADPARPREIALSKVPPTPWYKTWWGIGAMVAGGVAIASVTAYELTVSPPDKITGSASAH